MSDPDIKLIEEIRKKVNEAKSPVKKDRSLNDYITAINKLIMWL